MAKQLIQRLEVANAIDEGFGSATQVSQIKTAVIEIVSALAAYAGGRRQPTEIFMPHKSYEDAHLEFNRFLYW